jgi:hypothetical protein
VFHLTQRIGGVVPHGLYLLLGLCLLSVGSRAQQCRQTTFKGRVQGGEKFVQTIGKNLEFELEPFKDDQGWHIRVGPAGSADDWAWAVNPPFHSDNAQDLDTGYGETVRDQLQRTHTVRFPTSREQYQSFQKLAEAAQKDPNDGQAYLDALKKGSMGLVFVKAVDYDKQGSSDQVGWMNFEASVTVPKDFAATEVLNWSDATCQPAF